MEQGTVPASEIEGEGARSGQCFYNSDPMIAGATRLSNIISPEAELAILRRRLAIIGDQLGYLTE